MYLMPLNYALKHSKNGKFYVRCILPQQQQKKKNEEENNEMANQVSHITKGRIEDRLQD